MSQAVSLILPSCVRAALHQIIEDRRRPLKHILRAQIVLLSADRLPVLEIAKRSGVSRPTVWRWQQRFAEEGLDGLLRDKTRPMAAACDLSLSTVQRIWNAHKLQPHRVRTFKRSTDPQFAAGGLIQGLGLR